MNVLLISQCSKNALTETRRILDQFAERRGERTWQTAITQAGLDTLHRLLRKTARKNTAVACHWIRGKDHSELLWIVGDASKFNAEGAVPTNITRRNVLRSADENDWHSLQAIHLLASLAALLHDLGKDGPEDQQAPHAVDDGRHGRQQFHRDAQRPLQPAGGELGQEQRDAEAHRHGDQQRDQRTGQRAVDHHQAAEAFLHRVPLRRPQEGDAEFLDRRPGADHQRADDARQQGQRQPGRAMGQGGEERVAPGRAWPANGHGALGRHAGHALDALG